MGAVVGVAIGAFGVAAAVGLINAIAKYTVLYPHGTWLRQAQSILSNVLSSASRAEAARVSSEKKRVKERRPHLIEVFYAPDDPHCHVLVHALLAFCERYEGIVLALHLVAGGHGHSTGSLVQREWQRKDAALLADLYGFELPGRADFVAPAASVAQAQQVVVAAMREAAVGSASPDGVSGAEAQTKMLRNLLTVSTALFSENAVGMSQLVDSAGVSEADAAAVAAAGSIRLARAKHYISGMLRYEGELYWGIDRIKYLEERLLGLGVGSTGSMQPLYNKTYELAFLDPAFVKTSPSESVTPLPLELFYSPRSPYSQLAVERSMALADAYGVELRIRPVFPMVMRGLDVRREKGMYILGDFARESKTWGFPFGRAQWPGGFKDPLWEPTFRFMAVWPEAVRCGREREFIVSFARGCYCDGYDFGINSSFRVIVERAGLDFTECLRLVDEDAAAATNRTGSPWDDSRLLNTMANENMAVMDAAGLWGVPCLKYGDFFTWGADRLWAAEAAIRRRLEGRPVRASLL